MSLHGFVLLLFYGWLTHSSSKKYKTVHRIAIDSVSLPLFCIFLSAQPPGPGSLDFVKWPFLRPTMNFFCLEIVFGIPGFVVISPEPLFHERSRLRDPTSWLLGSESGDRTCLRQSPTFPEEPGVYHLLRSSLLWGFFGVVWGGFGPFPDDWDASDFPWRLL